MDDGIPAELSLNMQQLVDLVMRVFDLEEDQAPAVLARVKHLQRMDLLTEAQVGRGRNTALDWLQVAKVCLAFELQAAGLPSYQVADLLRQEPERCGGALRRSWQELDAEKPDPTALVLISSALEEVGRARIRRNRRYYFFEIKTLDVGMFLQRQKVGHAVVVLPAALMQRLREEISQIAEVTRTRKQSS